LLPFPSFFYWLAKNHRPQPERSPATGRPGKTGGYAAFASHVSSIPAKLWRVHLAETWIKYHLSLPSQPPIFPGPLLRLGKEVAAQGGHHTDLSQELGFSQQARQTAGVLTTADGADATDYEKVMSKGFTSLKPLAFTAPADEAIHNFRHSVTDKSKIAQMVLGKLNGVT
jgi:hypothetical protein